MGQYTCTHKLLRNHLHCLIPRRYVNEYGNNYPQADKIPNTREMTAKNEPALLQPAVRLFSISLEFFSMPLAGDEEMVVKWIMIETTLFLDLIIFF